MAEHLRAGREAEDLVARMLADRGFQIVARNVRVGRLELDIVARRGGLLVVCEVRRRATIAFGHPAETVDRHKIARTRTAALAFVRAARLERCELRFDVAAVVGAGDTPRVDYFEGAFDGS